MAYCLALPPALQGIHDVFNASNLCWYVPDPSHIIQHEPQQLEEKLAYLKEPMRILDRMAQTLRNKTIPYVKVL